jgi:serine/threonine protein kinase/tetratricopeptide (TPR) repeat protein
MSAEPRRPPPAAEDAGLVKGATIGRYVVLGLLGRGGMGEVYAAYDPELDRKIAVKLLRGRGGMGPAATADGKTRLLREAQAIARLSHPNVVVVFDVGTFGDSVFIAMEFVEGNTLGYWLQAANRSWREVLDVYVAAGRGLVAAHAAGLVHRDFKPDNVMITRTGQVRVMDFGLAREQGAADAPSPAAELALDVGERAAALADTFGPDVDPDATAKLGGGGAPGAASEAVASASGGYLRLKLTQTGATLGTPAYMAPEQFAGTGGDARSDQFSFCVALYEGVYGRRPFAGDNALALMSNVVAGTVTEPPPEARVPSWIRRILLRGLSTDPKQRHGSMTELLAALGQDPAVRRRRWLAAATAALFVAGAAAGAHRFSAGQQAICAGGPGRAATAWSPERRGAIERAFAATGNRNAARAFASAAALIDGYVARWTGMYTETCQATHVRGEQSADVLDLRMGCLGERLTSVRALGDVFSSADSGVVDNAVAAASALPALDRCADVAMLRAVIKPPDDPAVRAKVAAAREEVAKVKALGDSGQCERAAAAGASVVATAKTIGYRPLEAEAELELGRLGEACTETGKALGVLDDAVFDADASRHDQVSIEANLYAAHLYANRVHDTRMARSAWRHGQAVLARFSGHPILEAWLADSQADISLGEGRLDESLAESQKVLALKERALGPSNYDVAVSASNVALKLHALGRDGEAAPLIGHALDLFTQLSGRDSTVVAVALVNQAEILTGLGRFADAHLALGGALETFRKQKASSFYVGYALLDLGNLQLAERSARDAVGTFERAIELLGQQDRLIAAQAGFGLARARWSASPRERGAAEALAARTRETIASEPGAGRLLHDIDDWRAAHPAPRIAAR